MQGRESQLTGKRGSTATGTLAILQEGKIKHEYRGTLVHLEFLDLFLKIHDLCVSNMTIEDQVRIAGGPIVKYSSSEEYLFTLEGSDLVSNRFIDRQETESLALTMQPWMDMLNPMQMVTDILTSYEKDTKDYIDPELAAVVKNFLIQRKNMKEMIQMGIPGEIAKQAASQGYTAKNAETFIQQLGSQAAEAQMGGQGEF
jgi:hypothetical protein